jgi:hypothetical protein
MSYNIPGPGDLWHQEPRYHDDALGNLIEAFRNDPAKVQEADEWNEGMFDGDHYRALEAAIADLHEVEPSKLLDSEVLTRLYRLARLHGEAREARIERMARDEMDRVSDDGYDMEDAA